MGIEKLKIGCLGRQDDANIGFGCAMMSVYYNI